MNSNRASPGRRTKARCRNSEFGIRISAHPTHPDARCWMLDAGSTYPPQTDFGFANFGFRISARPAGETRETVATECHPERRGPKGLGVEGSGWVGRGALTTTPQIPRLATQSVRRFRHDTPLPRDDRESCAGWKPAPQRTETDCGAGFQPAHCASRPEPRRGDRCVRHD